MRELRKVVWAEGVLLGQQHLQHRDRYQQNILALRAKMFNPLAWGVLSLDIDEKALESGLFRLRKCVAVFPEGQLVSFDAAAGQSLSCDPGGRGGESVEIFLGLPANHSVEGITGYPGRGQLSAWQAEYHQIADEYDASREREVLLARPNLILLTGEESRQPFTSLKIAELFNAGDGTYQLRQEYIPAVTSIEASAQLQTLLVRSVELVGGRLRTLQERRRGGPAELAQKEPLLFAQLQVLSGAYPQLLHCQRHPELHPEQFYRLLVHLVGSLCPFGAALDPGELPAYRHADLGAVFPPLVQLLEGLFRVETRTRGAALRLARESASLLCADLEAELLESASFFLQVDFASEDANWITDFARQVKVGPRDAIEMILASALPGVRLVHTQRPPHQLSIKSGCEYYRLEPRGDFWERLRAERRLAVFLPQSFVTAEVDLVTVEEG